MSVMLTKLVNKPIEQTEMRRFDYNFAGKRRGKPHVLSFTMEHDTAYAELSGQYILLCTSVRMLRHRF